MKVHPIDCCIYPKLFDDATIDNKCEQMCKSTPHKHHCPRVCFLKDLEIYHDGKIKFENLKNLFIDGNNAAAGRGNVGDAWKDIVESSIKTCIAEYEVSESVKEEDVSMEVFDVINCVRRHNFVACPNYVDSKECADLKDAVKTCDKSTESMLFGVMHEERKDNKRKSDVNFHPGQSGKGF